MLKDKNNSGRENRRKNKKEPWVRAKESRKKHGEWERRKRKREVIEIHKKWDKKREVEISCEKNKHRCGKPS